MPFIPAPQVGQAVIKHLMAGEEINNVLHFGVGSVSTGAQLQPLANALLEAWTGAIMPLLSTAVTLVEVTVRELSTQDGIQIAAQNPTNVIGGIGGDAYPANIALCLTHRTALIGRSRRGRTYIGGLPELAGVGNFATASYAANLQAAFQSVIADVGVPGYVFGVLSRFSLKVARTTAVFTPVTSSTLRDLRFDSQRGRLPD